MRIFHIRYCVVVFFLIVGTCYYFDAKITDVVSENLITFFSIVFGFYITAIAILFSTTYAKNLYQRTNAEGKKSHIRILESYLFKIGAWSLFSTVAIIIFPIFASKGSSGALLFGFGGLNVPFIDFVVDLDLLASSAALGISAVNIYFMMLILRAILDGMIEEARETD